MLRELGPSGRGTPGRAWNEPRTDKPALSRGRSTPPRVQCDTSVARSCAAFPRRAVSAHKRAALCRARKREHTKQKDCSAFKKILAGPAIIKGPVWTTTQKQICNLTTPGGAQKPRANARKRGVHQARPKHFLKARANVSLSGPSVCRCSALCPPLLFWCALYLRPQHHTCVAASAIIFLKSQEATVCARVSLLCLGRGRRFGAQAGSWR